MKSGIFLGLVLAVTSLGMASQPLSISTPKDWKIELEYTYGWIAEQLLVNIDSSGALSGSSSKLSQERCGKLSRAELLELDGKVDRLFHSRENIDKGLSSYAMDVVWVQLDVWWPIKGIHEQYRVQYHPATRDAIAPPLLALIDGIWSMREKAATDCNGVREERREQSAN